MEGKMPDLKYETKVSMKAKEWYGYFANQSYPAFTWIYVNGVFIQGVSPGGRRYPNPGLNYEKRI
jgi:hypothetical protein